MTECANLLKAMNCCPTSSETFYLNANHHHFSHGSWSSSPAGKHHVHAGQRKRAQQRAQALAAREHCLVLQIFQPEMEPLQRRGCQQAARHLHQQVPTGQLQVCQHAGDKSLPAASTKSSSKNAATGGT